MTTAPRQPRRRGLSPRSAGPAWQQPASRRRAPRRPSPCPGRPAPDKPNFAVPPDTCDCHHHIYDRRWPAHPSATLLPADATVDDYRRFQQRIGNRRHVVVQPSTYGTDNRLLVDALQAFGPSARGVAVVDANVRRGGAAAPA